MSLNKVNITFALPNLLPGGAERVISFIAQNIDSEKFNSTLLIVGHKSDASYDIDNINIVYLEQPRVLNGIIPLYKYIKKEKPDIVVSAIGHLNTVTAYMSLFFPKIKFVAREVNVLSVLETFDQPNRLNPIHYLGDKRFNFFDKVICQSQDMLDDLKKSYSIKDEKLALINNPVTNNFKVKDNTEVNTPIRFITVARFDKEKGHPRILKALSQLDFPFHYTIIGKGAQEKVIFGLIQDYGLTDKITHIPFTKEVPRLLAESDLYLQGSYVEGFPNAVIESCMVGTPVLAINAPGGINEIIYNGINGHIVNDENEFVDYLNRINKDYKFKPKDVSETISSRYSSDIILKKYEDLFLSLIN
jgi:glycosyltransferase involved in cell wall biosynthesis